MTPRKRAKIRRMMIDAVVDELFIGPNRLRLKTTGAAISPVPTIDEATAEEYGAQVVDRLMGIIAAERAKADALAEALRGVVDWYGRVPHRRSVLDPARAAIAAYESDAPKEAGG